MARGAGAHARAGEVLVPEALMARIPDALSFDAAAGVPLAGLAALQALRVGLRLGPGSRVVIPGGAADTGAYFESWHAKTKVGGSMAT